MSEKKLLEESTIRRFQTLAGVKPIANGLIEEAASKKAAKKAGKEPTPAGGRGLGFSRDKDRGNLGSAGLNETYEQEEMAMHEADEEGAGAGMEAPAGMGGGETMGGGKGGDVKAEIENLVDALNSLLQKVGEGEYEVDVEAGGEAEEAPEAPMGGEEEEEGGAAEEEEEGHIYEEKQEEGKKKMEEKKHASKHGKKAEKAAEEEGTMEESLDLEIDDDEYLAEELTKRVAARLVAEMKKAKAVKEGKKGAAGSVAAASGKSGTHHSKPPKAKGSPTKGKVGTPFGGGKKK